MCTHNIARLIHQSPPRFFVACSTMIQVASMPLSLVSTQVVLISDVK